MPVGLWALAFLAALSSAVCTLPLHLRTGHPTHHQCPVHCTARGCSPPSCAPAFFFFNNALKGSSSFTTLIIKARADCKSTSIAACRS